MTLERVEISGFRGFADRQVVPLATPDGIAGSGLTLVVGPNNAGKSTVIDALRFLQSRDAPPQFGEGSRNAATRGRVDIRFVGSNGTSVLGTLPTGGGDVVWRETSLPIVEGGVFVVPARRMIAESPFQNAGAERSSYTRNFQGGGRMRNFMPQFSSRVVRMHNHRAEVDAILARVLDDVPEWTIEPVGDSGQHILRVYSATGPHLIDGVGEGIVSLLFLADALYDSQAEHIILIDEPEQSLHPSTQKRLATVLADYSKDRQIVCATHSPYLANWQFILDGAQIVRVYRDADGTRACALRSSTVRDVQGFISNHNNPHVLGTDAREVFFLNDGVILVEGQEDVVGYRILAAELGQDLSGDFYGWGVGGADNMRLVARIMSDLGFQRVVGILDSRHSSLASALTAEFPRFTFLTSPAADVRTKAARLERQEIEGLLDSHWKVRPEYISQSLSLLNQVNIGLKYGAPEIEDDHRIHEL